MIRNHAAENGYHYKSAYWPMANFTSNVLIHGHTLTASITPTEHNCIRPCTKHANRFSQRAAR